MTLDDATIERFSRQIILPEVGPRGQEQLATSAVLCAGLEPAVTTAAVYIAAAGVGSMGLADQTPASRLDVAAAVAWRPTATAQPRARSVAEAVGCTGGPSRCRAYDNASLALAESHWNLIVCGGADRALVDACNRAAITSQTPLVVLQASAAAAWIAGFAGHHPETPCWNCVSPTLAADGERPASSTTAGLLGALAAVEALKLLLGLGVPLSGRCLIHEREEPGVRAVPLLKAAECETCQRPDASAMAART